jgi:predicted SnoaL-like aldol condensation-catalyzing enzyme
MSSGAMRCSLRAGQKSGTFSGGGRPTKIVVDILRVEQGRLAEHWDVMQDEATRPESKSGLPMFGNRFPDA